MGKLSSVFMILLMINIIGYILMSSAIEQGFAVGNPYLGKDSLLVKLYTPVTDGDGDTVYVAGNSSGLFGSIPQEPPQSFIENIGQFIDRIFVLFDFVRVMLGVVIFPIALISYMGLPWQITQLFLVPLMAIYLLGFIDLLSGGDN